MPIDEDDPFVMPKEFSFPKDLKALSDSERDKLYRDFMSHNKTGLSASGDCAISPSKVMTPESSEFKAKQFLKKMHGEPLHFAEGSDSYGNKHFEFDPVKGYIVPGESEDAINSLENISPQDKARLLQPAPRIVTDAELDRAKMAVLPPVEREIEERFWEI